MNKTPLQPQQDIAHEEHIFDSIRNGYEIVVNMAQHVKIREDLIPSYAAALPVCSPENVLDDKHHYQGDDENTAAYILALDSINFGSGYEEALVREGWELIDNSLYFTLSTRLKQYFQAHGPLRPEQLRTISAKDCMEMLKLNESGVYSFDFAGLCAQALNELGNMVEKKYNGRFLSFVEAAENSAETMVRLLVQLHNFNDVHHYRGRMIPFYKRAQITAADLQLAFQKRGQTLFSDIGELTMFADNALPHVLHVDGILEYSDSLAGRIAGGYQILSGSEEEIEIRACAGHAVELIAACKGMISMDVDHILWHKSVEDPRYQETATHRTLSRFY